MRLFLSLFLLFSCSSQQILPESSRFCTPSQACWPSDADWKNLEGKLQGKLLVPESPLAACDQDPKGQACANARNLQKNPFHLTDHAGATQSAGWLGAWKSQLSARAVEAMSAHDIAAAVNFARDHKLRLVIRGTGHDWQGRSNAADSLLLWTHKMREIQFHEKFIPSGCGKKQAVEKAFMAGAGTRWLDTYKAVMVKHHVYVQGGGCTTVGAAGGFLQGGGFSGWSKMYGTSAANLVEAEVVTADGRVVVANACTNPDLFWALKGGGGGTWGVVAKVTMRTHPKPVAVGWIFGNVQAKTEESYKLLVAEMLRYYRKHLNNQHWGDGFTFNPDNSLSISMTYQGFLKARAEKVWAPFFAWVKGQPDRFTMSQGAFEIPGRYMWDADWVAKNMPARIKFDQRTGEGSSNFWGSGSESSQTSNYWYAYQSRWIPFSLFAEKNLESFAQTLFAASRHWPVSFFSNKGLAGASTFALRSARETSMNPAVLDAAGLVIAYAAEEYNAAAAAPNISAGEIQRKKVASAMEPIRAATPDAGTYFNQSDYFEPNWAEQFWGKNYPKLLAIKKKYDPGNLFTCHHCVGSE